MVSKEEIKKLADLARIDIKVEEQEKLASEIDAILEYVGQIKSVVGSGVGGSDTPLKVRGDWGVMNIMREDENPTESGIYSKELIAEFPESEDNYLKVKKI